MKIEVGKTYRTRDGGTVTITRDGDDPVTRRRRGSQDHECYAVGGDHTVVGPAEWAADGRFWSFGPSGLDIVAEVDRDNGVVTFADPPVAGASAAVSGTVSPKLVRLSLGNEVRVTDDPLAALRHDIRKLRIGGLINTLGIIVLAILAFLFSTRANATDIAAMPNAAGGEIVLTTDRGGCPDLYLLAYSRGDNGTVITGCWLPGTRYVLIKWSESGVIKLFAYDQFTPLVRQVPAAERRL